MYGGGGNGASGNTVTPTAEQIAEVRARQAADAREWQERQRVTAAARATARERAEALLLDWLTPQQSCDYHNHKYFDLVAASGRRWRVNCGGGQAGNIHLIDEAGQWVATYCAHPPGGLPDPDAWLAQRLQLLTDEPGFLAVANCHDFDRARYTRRGPRQPPEPLRQHRHLFAGIAAAA